MRYVVAILLFLVFGYSLVLVLVNNAEVAVNLMFVQVPQMNLGLLLIICIALGVFAGMLQAVVLFRVLQMKLENQRLNKEINKVREDLMKAQHSLEQKLIEEKSSVPLVKETPLNQ